MVEATSVGGATQLKKRNVLGIVDRFILLASSR